MPVRKMTPSAERPEPRAPLLSLYPVEPWRVREQGFDPANAARSESVFALANGHLGLRGNLEEDAGNAVHGTYLNGFHEEAPIVYPESAYGFARSHQVQLNIADGKRIRLEVDGEPLDLSTGEVEYQERSLDLRAGILHRRLRWRSPGGRRIELTTRRLVSFTRPAVALVEYGVTLLEAPRSEADVRVVSTLVEGPGNMVASDDPRVGSHVRPGSLVLERREADDAGGLLVQRTRTTNLAVAAAMRHSAVWLRGPVFDPESPHTVSAADDGLSVASGPQGPHGDLAPETALLDDGIACTFRARLEAGDGIRLTKALAYCSSLCIADDGLAEHRLADDGLAEEARALAAEALADGFDVLADEQAAVLAAFWHDSDVELEGDDALQQGLRFNLFTIFGSAGRDGRTNLSAKGLTGEGYEGHVFWDTEVFAHPFFVYTQPALARSLLEFRIATLPAACERAAEMSEAGALFPWRTINGREASAYFPAGTAQYHINADIALALVRYVEVTGDRSLLLDGGAELLFETARMWIGLGAYIPAQGGAFCLNEVTGPDEYTALVNNNLYTNLMARAHLRHAVRVADELARDEPQAWARLSGAIGLSLTEVDEWRQAADRMRVPRDAALGIHLQDDAFLDREPWDFAATPADRYPLLLHYHPLVIYRHQVLKQPDVVLAQVLLSHDFTTAEKRRNFAFYDPLTTGDSSLAPCIQSVAAAELGQAEAARRYFASTARMDLDDVNGNTRDGVHIAAMAGTWVSVVNGFAGLRDDDGRLSFAPRLPGAWQRLAFRLRVGASQLRIVVTPAEATYTVESGPPVELRHFCESMSVAAGQPAVFDLRPRLRAVVFDLDGVLTDTAELHFQAWARMAAEEGFPFSREVNERLKGIGRLESLEIILDAARRTDLDAAAKTLLTERKNAYFGELIAQITPTDLLPGIPELLADLRAAGIRTAIASASHNATEVVRRLEIEGLVDAMVDPATIVKGKPDPEIFLAAAERLGVRPDDCVGVEDARAGIEAINAAGMVSVGVGMSLTGAAWAVDDTRQITRSALAGLFGELG